MQLFYDLADALFKIWIFIFSLLLFGDTEDHLKKIENKSVFFDDRARIGHEENDIVLTQPKALSDNGAPNYRRKP